MQNPDYLAYIAFTYYIPGIILKRKAITEKSGTVLWRFLVQATEMPLGIMAFLLRNSWGIQGPKETIPVALQNGPLSNRNEGQGFNPKIRVEF